MTFFDIFNSTVPFVEFIFTRLLMLWSDTYTSSLDAVLAVLNWWFFFSKHDFSVQNLWYEANHQPYPDWMVSQTKPDIHAAPVIINCTNVSEGGINNPRVYPWVHRVSYHFSNLFFLLNQITLVLRGLFWLGLLFCKYRIPQVLWYLFEYD